MAISPFFSRLQHSDTELNDWIERLKRVREPAIASAHAHPTREIVEHIPAPPVVVAPERHRALTERAWIGPTQTNRLTGAVSHLRRVRHADGRYVTERIDGPAPATNDD